ncbi:secreted RxLR effector protein 161-like [Pyrus x bretschneideri]|uniref:secreted RxLR effector protein 161-like n=1 Tax=Pyrus x bretschneideri TaxID=225117 RepID=UPI0020308939|nr:secreted RxLR effector protein 161-like [Pyrus x bretschneideri]
MSTCAKIHKDLSGKDVDQTFKKIIKYVDGTTDFGLQYTHDSNTNLVGYSDADWAGCIDDRNSTFGGAFYLGNNLMAWHSKKQIYVSLPTVKAEYVVAGSSYTQLIWMKQMLSDYGTLHYRDISNLNKLDFTDLEVSGRSYLKWIQDMKLHHIAKGIKAVIKALINDKPVDEA